MSTAHSLGCFEKPLLQGRSNKPRLARLQHSPARLSDICSNVEILPMQRLYSSALPTAASPIVFFDSALKQSHFSLGSFSIACAGRAAADTAPMFTSPSTVTFPQGIYSSFTITTSGNPIPSITQTGHLPGGVKFTDNGDGKRRCLAGRETVKG